MNYLRFIDIMQKKPLLCRHLFLYYHLYIADNQAIDTPTLYL